MGKDIMRNNFVKVMLVVFVLAAIATPTYLWTSANAKAKTQVDIVKEQVQSQFLQQAFIAQYGGADVKLLGVDKTEDFLFYWSDSKLQHVSVYVQGKWVELGSAPIQTTETPK